MLRLITFILLLLLAFSAGSDISHPQPPTKLTLLEIKQRQNQTTLILTLQQNTTPSLFTLSRPDRLVIDLPNTQASSTLPSEIKSEGLIQHIRLGPGPAGAKDLRLVADLAKPSEYAFLLDQDVTKHQQIITVILTKKTEEETAAKITALPKASAEPGDLEDLQNQATADKEQTWAPFVAHYTAIKNSHLRKVIVMIDPGHGGKDTGAIGPDHDYEKVIVLAISKKLQAILNNTQGLDARLTRKGDYFISLRQRLNIARHNQAAMFIAIHADAYNNDTASGASVFALSTHGATSEAARWLAERENTSELSGINLKVKDRELKSVLLDMSQTATTQDSLQLGSSILNALKPYTPLHSDKVEQAGFVVLKSPDIPSVLVETGFVSNPQEEKLLMTPSYQDRIAEALAKGIIDYFSKNPPPDSWFEMQYSSKS